MSKVSLQGIPRNDPLLVEGLLLLSEDALLVVCLDSFASVSGASTTIYDYVCVCSARTTVTICDNRRGPKGRTLSFSLHACKCDNFPSS